jgi:hypothetical protein
MHTAGLKKGAKGIGRSLNDQGRYSTIGESFQMDKGWNLERQQANARYERIPKHEGN